MPVSEKCSSLYVITTLSMPLVTGPIPARAGIRPQEVDLRDSLTVR